MSDAALWSSGAALLLGAAHGINPGMGWLFAVALGLQERRTAAVWRALPPMALGHALSVALVIGVGLAVGRVVPPQVLRWVVAGTLVTFGLTRLARHRHPRWAAMRVGARDLTVWSFLMATAHGAGLMVLPFVLGGGSGGSAHGVHHAAAAHQHAAALPVLGAGLAPGHVSGIALTGLHTMAYLLVTGAVAVLVYRKLGLRLLRTAWINVDLLWGLALIVTGVVTPLL
jgi:hypothetical protein